MAVLHFTGPTQTKRVLSAPPQHSVSATTQEPEPAVLPSSAATAGPAGAPPTTPAATPAPASRTPTRRLSMERPHRGATGFGAYTCGGCRSWTESTARRPGGCQQLGYAADALPCPRSGGRAFGFYEPTEMSERVARLAIEDFELDELVLLAWRARKIQCERVRHAHLRFKPGQLVEATIHGVRHLGVVVVVNRRSLRIADGNGSHRHRAL